MRVVRATHFCHTNWATWAGSWVTFCGLGRFRVDIYHIGCRPFCTPVTRPPPTPVLPHAGAPSLIIPQPPRTTQDHPPIAPPCSPPLPGRPPLIIPHTPPTTQDLPPSSPTPGHLPPLPPNRGYRPPLPPNRGYRPPCSPNPGIPPPITPYQPPTQGRPPPRALSIAPRYTLTRTVNWSVCQTPPTRQAVPLPRHSCTPPAPPMPGHHPLSPPAPGLSPPGTSLPRHTAPGPLPHSPPRPTLLAQSSEPTSAANWSTPLAYRADLDVPGFPNYVRYIANQPPCTTILNSQFPHGRRTDWPVNSPLRQGLEAPSGFPPPNARACRIL